MVSAPFTWRGDTWCPIYRESTVADFLASDRIVVGVTSPWAEGVLRQMYAQPIADGTPLFATELETGELATSAAMPSWPRGSPLLMRWRRYAKPWGKYPCLSQILGADLGLARRLYALGSAWAEAVLKDIGAFIARAAELEVDQALGFLPEVDAINLRRKITHFPRYVDDHVGSSLTPPRREGPTRRAVVTADRLSCGSAFSRSPG